jgi:hypothetical protein
MTLRTSLLLLFFIIFFLFLRNKLHIPMLSQPFPGPLPFFEPSWGPHGTLPGPPWGPLGPLTTVTPVEP